MQVKILGVRGEIEPFAPRHKNHSGILIDKKLMFDLGEEKFLREKPRAVFITHLHLDHAFFARRGVTPPTPSYFKRGTKIFAPEKNKICPQIIVVRRVNKIGGYKITAIPTIHSKNVKSNAYLIEKEKKRLLYTGDMIWIKKSHWPLLKNLDAVITEGSFMKTGGMVRRDPTSLKLRGASQSGTIWGHQGMPDLVRFFSKFTKKIIFVHFGSWFFKNIPQSKKEIEKLGEKYKVEIITGHDGMEMNI